VHKSRLQGSGRRGAAQLQAIEEAIASAVRLAQQEEAADSGMIWCVQPQQEEAADSGMIWCVLFNSCIFVCKSLKKFKSTMILFRYLKAWCPPFSHRLQRGLPLVEST
jgi:hypothetical protein